MQTLFRNPLAGPDVLGVSAGAGLGVALLTLLSRYGVAPNYLFIRWNGSDYCCCNRCFTSFNFNMGVSARIKDSITILVLGMILGMLQSALVTILQSFADPFLKCL